jgi:hypothetical protein
MKHPFVAAAGAWTAVAILFSAPAHAVEREHQLGADLGGSMLIVSGKNQPDVGGIVGVHWTYGLSDAFNLMAEGQWSLVALDESPKAGPVRPSWVGNVDVGVSYVFDVLQWVPYAGVLVGGYDLSGGTIPGLKLLAGAVLAFGVDYRFTRSLLGGVALRQHMLTDASVYPSFTQAFLRAEYAWGW